MKSLSLRNHILLLAVLPSILVALLLAGFMAHSRLTEIEDHVEQRASVAARQLAVLGAGCLKDENRLCLLQLTSVALEEPGVRSVRFLDTGQRNVAASGPRMQAAERPDVFNYDRNFPRSLETDSSLRLAMPIYANDVSSLQASQRNRQHLGWVEVEYSDYAKSVNNYQTYIMLAVAINIAALISIALGNLAIGRLNKRILRIRDWMRNGGRGIRPATAKDELGLLQSELATLRENHEREISEMQQSVDQTMVDLRETLETVEIQNIELDAARKEAIEASRAKSEFLANTSHEIRTPLNGIIGFANMMARSLRDARHRNAAETIRRSAENLLTIINDILDFSKMDSGKLLLDEVPVNLQELAEDSLALVGPEAHEKGLELLLFVDDKLPPSMTGDPLRLRQVLTNLISNAVKFTHRGQIQVNLHCQSIANSRAKLRVEVRDSGIGLDREQLNHIFEPFVQGDASVTRKYGGTGLGLVIAKRLVEAMRGEIGVRSVAGQGSTFWFNLDLPLARESLPERPFEQLKGKRALVYEEQDMSFHTLRAQLGRWRMEVDRIPSLEGLLNAEPEPDSCRIACLSSEEMERLSSLIDGATMDRLLLVTPQSAHWHSPYRLPTLHKPVPHLALFDDLCQFFGGALPWSMTPDLYLSSKRVLAVDDNHANLKLLELLLTDAAARVSLASSGLQAVELSRDQAFDIIFMDIQMPEMDGLETTRRIRASDKNSKTPVVAVSAHLSPQNPAELRDAGVNFFISKPVTDEKLQDAIRHCNREPGKLAHSPDESSTIQTSNKPQRPIDIEGSLAVSAGNRQVAAEMMQSLIDSLPTAIDELHGYLVNGSLPHSEAIGHLAHRLRGGCAYSKLPALEDSLLRLEETLSIDGLDEHRLSTSISEVIDTAQALLDHAAGLEIHSLFE